MPQMLEEYRSRLPGEVQEAAPAATASGRNHPSYAFHLGRSLGREEYASDVFWVRLRWFLLGAAAGVSVAAVYLQIFLRGRIPLFPQ